jgi:hypothetical protein
MQNNTARTYFIKLHHTDEKAVGVQQCYFIDVTDISHITCTDSGDFHRSVVYLKTTVYDKQLNTFVNATLVADETVEEINAMLGFRGV